MHQQIARIVFISLLAAASLVGVQLVAFSQTRTTIVRPELGETKSQYYQFFSHSPVKRPCIAVVLSGGGARGISAIGALRVFEQNDIPIDLIVGTSIGSVVGGLYAMGYSTEQLQQIVDTTNWEDLLSYTDEARRREMFLDQKIASDKSVLILRFDGFEPVIPKAFSSGQRLTNYLNLLTLQGIYKPISSFDDLRIPFRAVTTDLVTGNRIVIDRGDMTEALRASLAVPLLFSTVLRDTMQLLDGGLVDNLPVDVAIDHQADIIVAVDMVSPLRPRNKLNALWEVADQITTIMMQGAVKLAREKADIVIAPALGDRLPSDFTNLDSLIAAGESAAEAAVPVLKKLIKECTIKNYGADSVAQYVKPRFFCVGGLPPSYQDTLEAYEKRGWVAKMELQSLVNNVYETGDYAAVEAVVEQAADSTIIQINVLSNPILQAIDISGNQVFSSDTLLSVFSLLIGRPLNANHMVHAIEHLLAIYRNAGYSFARIKNVRVDSTRNSAGICIDEGIVHRTDIRGTSKTRDWVLRRELPWRENDLLTVSKVSEGISNLYGTNLFEQVRFSVHYEGDSSQRNITTIYAHERSTGLIHFGLRADNERNIQPSINIRDENLFGVGAEVGLLIGGGTRNQSYIGDIKATRIFNSYLTFSLKGYSIVRDIHFYADVPSNDPNVFESNRVGEYREVHNGGLASFGMQLERLGSVTVEGRLEKVKVYNIFNTPITNQEYNISSIRFGTNVDTQDKFPYPTDGLVINFFYESALVKFINAVGFTKMFFSYDKYYTFHERHTIHPRFIVGVADDALPISEQFSLGGQHSFFGFREDNSRGRQLVSVSLEYQYKLPFSIFFDTYFKARYDFGSVWEKTAEMRLMDFRHGLGITIGLDTPIGPAEFSLGRSFYVNKLFSDHPLSLGPFVAYFSIGYPIAGVIRN